MDRTSIKLTQAIGPLSKDHGLYTTLELGDVSVTFREMSHGGYFISSSNHPYIGATPIPADDILSAAICVRHVIRLAEAQLARERALPPGHDDEEIVEG